MRSEPVPVMRNRHLPGSVRCRPTSAFLLALTVMMLGGAVQGAPTGTMLRRGEIRQDAIETAVSWLDQADLRAQGIKCLWRVSRQGQGGATGRDAWFETVSLPPLAAAWRLSGDPREVGHPEVLEWSVWDGARGAGFRFGGESDCVVGERFQGLSEAEALAVAARLSDPEHPWRWWSGVGAAHRISCATIAQAEVLQDGSLRFAYDGPLGSPQASEVDPFQSCVVDPSGLRVHSLKPPPPQGEAVDHLVSIEVISGQIEGGAPLPSQVERRGVLFLSELPPPHLQVGSQVYELVRWDAVEPQQARADLQQELASALEASGMPVYETRGDLGYAVGSERARVDGVDYVIRKPSRVCESPGELLDLFPGEVKGEPLVRVHAASSPTGESGDGAIVPIQVDSTDAASSNRTSSVALWLLITACAIVLALSAYFLTVRRREGGGSPSTVTVWRLAAIGSFGVLLGMGWVVWQGSDALADGAVIHLGTVEAGGAGAEASRTLAWTNETGSPVTIAKIITDCGCLSVTPATREVGPGESVEMTFTMHLARPEVRTVGATMVFAEGDPIRWSVQAEAVGGVAVRAVTGSRELRVGRSTRWDVLIPVEGDDAPRIDIYPPVGVDVQVVQSRRLDRVPREVGDVSKESIDGHWQIQLEVRANDGARSSAEPDWKPRYLKGVLDDGRMFNEWFVLSGDSE